MRLDGWLAALGQGSRAQVRALIRAGLATVNGVVVREPG